MPLNTMAQKRASQAAKLSLTTAELLAIRSNPVLRDDFLKRLAAACRPQIAAIIMRGLGKDNGIIDGEARQIFMLTASEAIDSARTEDDGRGQNDPVKWATWRGLNAVRQLLRDIHCRRPGQPSPRQVFEQNLVYQSDLEATYTAAGNYGLNSNNDTAFDYALARGGQYRRETAEEEAIVNSLIDELMGVLTAQERPVAELLIHGRLSTGEVELECVCPPQSGHHCVTNDISHATGINEQTVRRIIKRIQSKATQVFEVPA